MACRAILSWCLLVISLPGPAQETLWLQISNTLNLYRDDELIVVSRNFLEKKFHALGPQHFVHIETPAGEPIFVQHDDLNGDGIWDEIDFIQNLLTRQDIRL
jgi:hypothetical protein